MINCRIFVKNDNGIGDQDEFYLKIKLPAIPYVGMRLFVDLEPLEQKIREDIYIARFFHPNWFYFESRDKKREELNNDDLVNLSFEDAIVVSDIYMDADCDYVYIELSSF